MAVVHHTHIPSLPWVLTPDIHFLNHGSFGACPKQVLQKQQELRARMEAEPVQFLDRELPELLFASKKALGEFVGAGPEDLVFVTNATTGVNTVLQSFPFDAGDEILITDHSYNACKNAALAVAKQKGLRLVTAHVPFPVDSSRQILDAILGAVSQKTRMALVDHVTSPTALVFPIKEIVQALKARNVLTLVDGAHAPGMVPLDLDDLGAAFYTGNCHKWLCAPKGAGFLHVQKEYQKHIHPLVVSHAYSDPVGPKRFLAEFDWTGTQDPTPFLCVSEAIRFLRTLVPSEKLSRDCHDVPGFLSGSSAHLLPMMLANHQLVIHARERLCESLGQKPPCPNDLLGSMATLFLPDHGDVQGPAPKIDPIQFGLYQKHGIEVPVMYWPAFPKRVIRVSAQAYNDIEQYKRLGEVLRFEKSCYG